MARANDDLLADVIGFCEEVQEHLQGVDLEDYLESKTLQRAVERTLELIGEAATQLGSARPKIAVPWDEILALRIVLAHLYTKVEQRLLYRTAVDDVPKLLAALRAEMSRRQK